MLRARVAAHCTSRTATIVVTKEPDVGGHQAQDTVNTSTWYMSLVTDTSRLCMPMAKLVVATMAMGTSLPSHDLRRPLPRGRPGAPTSRGAEPPTVAMENEEGGSATRMSRRAKEAVAARAGV